MGIWNNENDQKMFTTSRLQSEKIALARRQMFQDEKEVTRKLLEKEQARIAEIAAIEEARKNK